MTAERIVRRTTEEYGDYTNGFSDGIVDIDVSTISTAREDYSYCPTAGGLMIDGDRGVLLIAYRCLTCGGRTSTGRDGRIDNHFTRVDQIVLLRRLADVWATWPMEDLELLLRGAAMVEVPELMDAIAAGKRKYKLPIGGSRERGDEPYRLGSASDYPFRTAVKYLDTLYRNKPVFAGQSSIELAHHEAAVRLFGAAESGRSITDRGMSRSSWKVDIYVELPDERIVIEYDGRYWHEGEEQIAADIRKSTDLLLAGYVVARLRAPGLDPLPIDHPRYREFAAKPNEPRLADRVIASVHEWVRSLRA